MSSHLNEDKSPATLKSNLEIVKTCDNFPYNEPISHSPEEQDKYSKATANLWKFLLPEDPTPYGYIPSSIITKMPWTPAFQLNPHEQEIRLLDSTSPTQSISSLLSKARAQRTFSRLGPPRTEAFPILGAPLPIQIERSAASLFGIVTRGAHMNIFSRGEATGEILVWIARRNATKATYPDLLDNAVAGGVAAGETPWECILHEAMEEAALEEGFVTSHARSVGCVSWFNISDERAGGEIGLLNHGVLYVYDMEIEPQMQLVPVDGDIQGFYRMGVEEILEAMARDEFKPSCANVMMDFFVRHGILTPENEGDYVEIVARLHRKLEFPTTSPKV